MRYSFLRYHVQKKILFKRNMYRKDIEQTRLNKLAMLIRSHMKKYCLKSFSNSKNPSDIEAEVIKQINLLKLFYMKPRS